MKNEKNDERVLHEALASVSTAMLVTHAPDGELRARPMHVADVVGSDELWFATSSESEKTDELARDPRVVVTMQAKNLFVSLSGHARPEADRQRIHALWSSAWKPWFPEGPDDPRIVLLRVTGHSAEVWDMSGANRLRYLYEAGKAVLKGERIDDAPGHHQVEL